jgi:ATP-binding cassette subfamily C protein LapB
MTGFINRHPRGFDMPVGERGESLSGGQRQSVGLARAVLHNAPSCCWTSRPARWTSPPRRRSRSASMRFAQNKTVVLVTHRTSLLAMVTRVIVIDGGKIVADGPRDRIMEALQSGRIAKAACGGAHGTVFSPPRRKGRQGRKERLFSLASAPFASLR